MQSSGRIYSCDEFQPASWIEGGVSITGQGGRAGTTYCAPSSWKCQPGEDGIGSEQNWQGTIHGFLGSHLEARLVADGQDVDFDTPARFWFAYNILPGEDWAVRVTTANGDPNEDFRNRVHPNPSFRRSITDNTRTAISFIPNANGSLAIGLLNGEVFRTHERGAKHRARKRARDLVLSENDANLTGSNDTAKNQPWFVDPKSIIHPYRRLTNIPLQAHHCGRCQPCTEYLRPSDPTRSRRCY